MARRIAKPKRSRKNAAAAPPVFDVDLPSKKDLKKWLKTGPIWLGVFLAFLLGLASGYRPIWDMDFHWHIAAGRYDMTHGLDPAKDPFTYLPIVRSADIGFRTIDRALAEVERWGGLGLVRSLFAVTAGLIYAQAFRLGATRSQSLGGGALLLGVVAAASADRLRHRPDVLAIFFFLVLLELLERKPSTVTIFLHFGLTALWSRIHPSAALAPALALVALPGPSPAGRFGHLLGALGGLMLFPGGPVFYLKLLEDTAAVAPLIPEWRALWELDPKGYLDLADYFGLWMLVLLAGVLYLWGWPVGKGKPGPGATAGSLFVGGIMLIASAWSIRLFYGLAAPVAFAVARRASSFKASKTLVLAALILGGLLVAAFPMRRQVVFFERCREAGLSLFSSDLYEPNFPTGAVRFLKQNALKGRLFHPPQWGGYLASELVARYRVAHDGRTSLWGRKLGAELLRFNEAKTRASLIERFGIEILVVAPGSIPETEQAGVGGVDSAERRWLRVFDDGISQVFVDRLGANWSTNQAVLRSSR